MCSKYPYDLVHYLNIYNKIHNKDYSIEDDVYNLCESDAFLEGEKLSIKKKFDYLLNRIDFYVLNGNSFVVKE